ncbi:unnamed protein product [Peniophora sp. CBMAI 1063]|nr:unnamed protein product [Peniophora sp. CBMAI 1063]
MPAPSNSPLAELDENVAPNDIDRLWTTARERYKKETGRDLSFDSLPSGDLTPENAIEYFEQQNDSFKAFRAVGRKGFDILRPIVNFTLVLKKGTEGATDLVPVSKGIFGAIGVLLQATKGVSELYDAVDALLQEILVYLERLSIHFEPPETPRPRLKAILTDALVQVFIALAIATKYCDLATPSRGGQSLKRVGKVFLRRTKDYLFVLTDKPDVKAVLDRLRSLAVKEEQIVVAGMSAIARKVGPKVDYVHHKAVIDALQQWLDPPNPRPTNYDAKRHAGSCAWFFDNTFSDWKDHKNGIYWVHSNAGAGKSVLSFSVVDKLKEDASLPLAYFHFDFNDVKKQHCRALVSSLVFQIGTRFQVCLDYLKELRSPDAPNYEQLLSMLSRLLSLSGPVFVILDALDECPERGRDRALTEFLDMLRSFEDDAFRLLITCRPEAEIRRRLSHLSTHSLSLHGADEHLRELRRHIEGRLSDREAYLWPDCIRRRAQKILCEMSQGMFLWVDLQLQSLKHCAASDVEQALCQLPLSLSDTYERILNSFTSSKVSIERARLVFQCVAVAREELSADQIVDILSAKIDSSDTQAGFRATDAGSTALKQIDRSSDHVPDIIRATCPPLLEVVEGAGEAFKLDYIFSWSIVPDCRALRRHIRVQFIHVSARDYLLSAELKRAASLARLYSFDIKSAEIALAKTCLSALNGPPDDPDWYTLYPSRFCHYAASHWQSHISPDDEAALGVHLLSFLSLDSPAFERWWTQNGIVRSTRCLATAVRLGLRQHLSRLLDDASVSTANIEEELRDALYAAVEKGDKDMTRTLLDCDVLVRGNTVRYYPPLDCAASSGQSDMVRMLLEHPRVGDAATAALYCRASFHYDTKLSGIHCATILFGDFGISGSLMDHGATLDALDNNGLEALRTAAKYGSAEIVRTLLAGRASDGVPASVSCNIGDMVDMTVLHLAAQNGHAECIRTLLDSGAQLDTVDRFGHTPLYYAQRGRHSDAIRVLSDEAARLESTQSHRA